MHTLRRQVSLSSVTINSTRPVLKTVTPGDGVHAISQPWEKDPFEKVSTYICIYLGPLQWYDLSPFTSFEKLDFLFEKFAQSTKLWTFMIYLFSKTVILCTF
jgi:hypothetical protein